MVFEAPMREAARLLRVALSFLTIFPVGNPEFRKGDLGRSAFLFPLVGALLGMSVWACYAAFTYIFPGTLIPPVVTAAVWVVLTGGLHLDGWADVCDAIFSSQDQGTRNRVLKDSRIGVFGAAGMFFLLGLKVAALHGVDLPWVLVIATVAGRVSALEVGFFFPPPTGGLGKEFIGTVSGLTFFSWVLICGGLAWWMGGAAGALKTGMTFIIIYIFGLMVRRSLGSMGGDGVGASVELAEVMMLVLWVA